MVTEHSHVELLEQLNADIDTHRVLWMVAQIRPVRPVWAVAEIFRNEPEIVERVVRRKLLEQPKGSDSYVFTQEGHEELGRWFESVYPRREMPGFLEIWKRVTGLDH